MKLYYILFYKKIREVADVKWFGMNFVSSQSIHSLFKEDNKQEKKFAELKILPN